MIAIAAAIGAVALGITIAMIILAGRQTEERPGYITDTDHWRQRARTARDERRQHEEAWLEAAAAAGSSRVRAESGQADLGGDAA